jgi:hypothetical protein
VVVDITPADRWRWWVNGETVPGRRASFPGRGLTFRILGGDFLIVRGDGLSLSATGNGTATLTGVNRPDGSAGVFSTDAGAECQASPFSCSPVTGWPIRVRFGAPARESELRRSSGHTWRPARIRCFETTTGSSGRSGAQRLRRRARRTRSRGEPYLRTRLPGRAPYLFSSPQIKQTRHAASNLLLASVPACLPAIVPNRHSEVEPH